MKTKKVSRPDAQRFHEKVIGAFGANIDVLKQAWRVDKRGAYNPDRWGAIVFEIPADQTPEGEAFDYTIAEIMEDKQASEIATFMAASPKMANALRNAVAYLRRKGPAPIGVSDEVIATLCQAALDAAEGQE